MSSPSFTRILFIICVGHLLGESFAAKLTISPDTHDVMRSTSVDITCKPDGSERNYREIAVLQILGPGKKVLVSLHQGQQIVYNGAGANRFLASGSLHDASLTLTISDVQPTDLGVYTCGVTYIKTNGKVDTHEGTGELSESDLSSIFGTELKYLGSIVSDLQGTVDELSRKANTKSAFMVSTQQHLDVKVAEKIKFSDVMLTYGLSGYDKSTGIYTAPVDGLYVFHVTISLNCKKCGIIAYLKANRKTLAGIGAHDNDYYDQSTASTIASLKKGDEVYVVPSAIDFKAKVGYRRFSNFNGFLLEAY